MIIRAGAGVLLTGAIAVTTAVLAHADTFTPVRLQISVTPVVRAHKPMRIAVTVSADPGALARTAPLRVQVKLASECGGTYQYTTGPVLLDKRLSPQPSAIHAYSATVRGSGRPNAYGQFTVCTWLTEEGDDRVFASDQSIQVSVSRACTAAAARYDAARSAHRRRSVISADHRAARKACGPGVAL